MSPAIGGFALTRARVLTFVGVLVLGVVIYWFRGQLNLQRLHDHATELNGVAVFAALCVLPLLGFPVSVLHAVTGAKFGLPLGMTLVFISIAFQLGASYGIVHLFPDFFARRFDWLRRKLPPTTHRSLTLFTMLLPGAPYFAQNYVLAVAAVPFRIFFFYSLPLNFVRSLIGVIFGEWSDHLTPVRIGILVVYAITVTVACGLAFRRLRAQLRNRSPAAGGRKRRA